MIIDGALDDWKNGFQAYNTKTGTFYCIANDDTNLYFIIKTGSHQALKKVLLGGIAFTLKKENSRTVDGILRITHPAYDKSIPNWQINWDPPADTTNKIFNRKEADSIMKARNEMLSKKLKLLALKEMNNNSDTLLSVYNAKGIKIRSKFDITSSYVTEWSIPLKLIYSSGEPFGIISYKIELPGGSAGKVDVLVDTERQLIFFTGANGGNYVKPLSQENLDLASPTFFSGKYVMAK